MNQAWAFACLNELKVFNILFLKVQVYICNTIVNQLFSIWFIKDTYI